MSRPAYKVAPEPALEIKRFGARDGDRWDAFVQGCPTASFFHLSGWKEVIERSFGHPTFYLYAESAGEIRGVLPLGQVKSRLFGNALISVPFLVLGGVASTDDEAREALEEAARALARELQVDYLELRYAEALYPGPPVKDLYVRFRAEIDPDPAVNLKRIPRKQRAMIRKGMGAGLASTIDADLDRFYQLFSESQRNLGTPVLPKRWFRHLREVFGDACEVLTVTRNREVVSSVMSFYFRDEVLPYYGGGRRAARALKGNDFMYWELMRRACERGTRIFDYGRSKKGTGSYNFKKNWGFEPEPLHYEYHLVRANEVPDINPLNPRFRLAVSAWQRLPLPVSRTLGPMIARYLG